MDRQRENLTRGVNTGCRREESWLGFPSCLLMWGKKIQGEKMKAKISLKGILDEKFECLHFELIFLTIYSVLSAGKFSG